MSNWLQFETDTSYMQQFIWLQKKRRKRVLPQTNGNQWVRS